MSYASLDLSSLLLAHTGLSALASLSNAPLYAVPVALYGLVTVQRGLEGSPGAEAGRTFVAVFAASIFLDIVWFFSSDPTSKLAGLFIFLNFLLKPVTILAVQSQLTTRGEGFQGNFSLPPALAERMPGGFPSQGSTETLWSAPQPAAHVPYQGRFSLDEEAGVGSSGSGASTPPARASATKKAGPPAPSVAARAAPTAAEGGGYHALE